MQRAAVGAARAGEQPPAGGVAHVADGVDRDQRADAQVERRRTVRGRHAHAQRSAADAALHRPLDAPQLADGGAGACADRAPRRRAGDGGGAGGVAGGGVGAEPRVAEPEVVQHRRRNDRHARRADRDADAALVEPAHHAAGGVEPERAAAGEQHARARARRRCRGQQVGLARARRGAAHVDAGDGAVAAAQHDGAAGGRRASVWWPTAMPAMSVIEPVHGRRAAAGAPRALAGRRRRRRPSALSGEHAGAVLHARRTSPRWCSVSP